MSTFDPTQPVDPQALALTHAIALQESGSNGVPDYNATGDAGTSKGAYQWQPGNFEAAAKNAGLDPNDFSPANQDKVAYSEVKGYKDKGYDPGQIASLWNSGSPDNWKNHSGSTTINGKTISYDTPAYVKGVQSYYQQLTGSQSGSSGTTPQTSNVSQPTTDSNGYVTSLGSLSPTDSTTQPQEPSLGSELGGRIQDASSGLSTIVNGTGHGTGLLSGGLQVAGAAAGALGDVVNKGIELIPGVKAIEGLIGSGVSKLAQTAPGQAIVNSLQTFAKNNPELSKDAGAVFNIATALPILDGLGTVGKVALDSGSMALKDAATKTFTQEVTSAIGKDGTSVAKDMIEKNILPTVKNGAYDITDALDKLKALRKTITVDSDMRRTDAIKEALQSMSGKSVKSNPIGNVVKGLTSKLPVANYVGEAIGNKAEGLTTGILKRTAKGASRVGLKQGAKKVAGLVGGALAQKANQNTP